MAVIIPYFRTAIRYAANRNSIGRHLGDYYTNWNRRHLGGLTGRAAPRRGHPIGPARRAGRKVGRAVPASRKAVGARVPRDRYCTSTTTLKNRIAAFSAAVAPSTASHGPSSDSAPFTTARAPGTFHCD